MRNKVFTKEANRIIKEECLKFKENLMEEAISEALRQRGEPLEVTQNDVMKARKKFVKDKQELRPATDMILKIYSIFGLVVGFLGWSIPFIEKVLSKVDYETKLGIMISVSGFCLTGLSYLMRKLMVYRNEKYRISRVRYNERNISDEIEQMGEILSSSTEGNIVPISDVDNDRSELLAKLDPRTLIIESWIMIEKTIVEIISRRENDFSEKPNFSSLKMLELLRDKNYIDMETFNKLNTMRMIRNKAVHSGYDDYISTEEAHNYRQLGLLVVDKLNNLNPQKKVYISYNYPDDFAYCNLIMEWNSDNKKFVELVNLQENINSENMIIDQIDELIKISDVVVLLVGNNTDKSKYVNIELTTAAKYNKKIIPVKLNDSVNMNMYSLQNVKWLNSLNKDELKKALYE